MPFIWPVLHNKQQECFGDAFLHAVAAVAGCTTAKPAIDDDSIDWTLSCRLGPTRPKLDIQMKSTGGDDGAGTTISFRVEKKNYDDLRAETLVPRLLVVALVPDDVDEWMEMTVDQMLLRRCVYWYSLRNAAPVPGATTTLHIPRANVFDVDSLRGMMQRVNEGRPL